MKKYIWLALLTALLLTAALLLPNFVLSGVPTAQAVAVSRRTDDGMVQADGKAAEQNRTEISPDFPVVTAQVLVEVGDTVQVGQKLAVVDAAATLDALSEAASGMSEATQKLLEKYLPRTIDLSMVPSALYSTASGVVTALSMQPESLTPFGEPAAVISDLHTLEITAPVGQAEAKKIQEGQLAVITGSGFDGNIQAQVRRIAPTAHTRLNGVISETVVNVTLSVDNSAGLLKPGYQVQADIETGGRTFWCVPYAAVEQDEDGQEYVYVYQDGHSVRKNVQTGEELEDVVEIVSGVAEKDPVLIPAQKLSDGGQVLLEKPK